MGMNRFAKCKSKSITFIPAGIACKNKSMHAKAIMNRTRYDIKNKIHCLDVVGNRQSS